MNKQNVLVGTVSTLFGLTIGYFIGRPSKEARASHEGVVAYAKEKGITIEKAHEQLLNIKPKAETKKENKAEPKAAANQ